MMTQMTIKGYLGSLGVAVLILPLCASAGWTQHKYSKAVQNACVSDYKAHCGEYGIETEALRVCMDRAGRQLTKACVDALVAAGEVSEQEVERRKKGAR